MLRSHESYALDMKASFEAVLKAYEEQEGINTDSLNAVGGQL